MLNIKKMIPFVFASTLLAASFVSADEKAPVDGQADSSSARSVLTSLFAQSACVHVAPVYKTTTVGEEKVMYGSRLLNEIGLMSMMGLAEIKGAYFDPTTSQQMVLVCMKRPPGSSTEAEVSKSK